MIGWYDKQLRQITAEEANALFADPDYKRVGWTDLGGVIVSTVWLGLDYSVTGRMHLFETMVFEAENGRVKNWRELDCTRYSTEDEAKEGHENFVALWREKTTGGAP